MIHKEAEEPWILATIIRKVPVKIITADMSGTQAETAGMVCGGRIEVLLEVIE